MLNDYWNEEGNFENAVWELQDRAEAAQQELDEDEFYSDYI